ncbi:MAG: hypothetical protein KDC76_13460 [Bacteroidetes bacterium]|nr:hypothetical protein [Bacteroidota bacterium]
MRSFLAFVILLSIAVSSCKEEDPTPEVTTKTTAEKLQAKWGLVSVIDYNYIGMTTDLDGIDTVLIGGANDFVEYKSDGTYEFNVDGDQDVAAYKLVGDSKLIMDGDTFDITTLNETALILTYKDRESEDWYDNVVTLKK